MKKLVTIFVMVLLATSCVSLKETEQSQDRNIMKKENVESKYAFSENVGIYYVNKQNKLGETNSYSSSATYFSDNYGFTTAHSLSSNSDVISVHFKDEIINAKVIGIINVDGYNQSIAVLYFERKPIDATEITYANNFMRQNENVYLSGFPKGKKEFRIAKLLHMSDDKIILEKSVEPGMSGGLALNKNGKVLGIIVGSLKKKDVMNTNFFIQNKITDDEVSLIISVDNTFKYLYAHIKLNNNAFLVSN